MVQIEITALGEAIDEVLYRGSAAIMLVKINVHAFAEPVSPHQAIDHPYQLSAFFIDGGCVKIIDLKVAVRAHIVGQRAAVFWELMRAKKPHVRNTLHRARTHVGGKLLVPKNSEPFFKAKLEPVTAGNAVARPIVEIFMCHDRFNIGKINVGRGVRVGQNIFVVENIQTFVFHSPHVEGAHGNNHENIEIIFAAEFFFIPLHRGFE